MARILRSALESLEAGQPDEGLAELAVLDSYEARAPSALALRCLAYAFQGDWPTAAGLLKAADQEAGGVLRLLRVRAPLETGEGEEAQAALEVEGDEPELVWLRFCAALARVHEAHPESREGPFDWLASALFEVDSSGNQATIANESAEVDALRRCFSQLSKNDAWAVLLQVQLWLRALKLRARSRVLEAGAAADEMLIISELLEGIDPVGRDLRRAIRVKAAGALIKAGRREEALGRFHDMFLHPKSDSEDLLAWGRILKQARAPEAEVLFIYKKANERERRQFGDGPVTHLPRAAIELAETYVEYGFTREARALLYGFVDADLRDPLLFSTLRRLLFLEVHGTEDDEPPLFEGAIPEPLGTRPRPPSLELEPLSILFLKAEAIYNAFPHTVGDKVIDLAKPLKSALKDRDYETAAQYESLLAQLICGLEERSEA